jgi:hypothetical protein
MKTWISACLGLLLASTAWGVSIDDRCLQDGNSACVDWNQGLVIADGLGRTCKESRNLLLNKTLVPNEQPGWMQLVTFWR